ncbi:MAG: hypothetical protein A3C54_07500 [Deltaproteobacteria bacterium RIFCSPHIGHO2_02_FULL_60_17]|nr:MAG: hypothetical protein A3C54_07500 [Deltaproteobacteria bacterium RIFCSPHIGHO2_02_FULL_60_17]
MSAKRSDREEELLKEGWTKQFLASGPRLQEAAELYKSMGLEVHLEPARAEDLACSECHVEQSSATIEGWYVIYTRPREKAEDGPSEEEELW